MSEQEIREGMLLAVWDEPPLDFDPDVLMKRAEQKKSRRRALVSVGVATALIAVSAFALPSLLPKTGGDDQIASQQTTSPAPTPTEAPDARALRISNALAEKLGTEVPDLREVYANLQPGPVYQLPSSTTRSKAPGTPPDPSLHGYVYLTDYLGPTALQVIGSKNLQSQRTVCAGALTCRELGQEDGSKVFAAEFQDGNSTVVRAVSSRIYQSGYTVQVMAFTTNPATGSGLRQELPVSVDVLTALVTDPRIRWE
ncbi:hypothetical protein BBK82_15845 [Lentzea guizhouensis]|uniref:Uncharacterized protein n=1 Tax=Lentzea guizhouensis TaxID=1586287 RepID=A0A1B2HHV7_9PSEU|nr:hypothetical protein [Lentzea guizhouensis]ANZ37313.1 hypothetical protein BBK82_15845 [Lentzea guizhouensis]